MALQPIDLQTLFTQMDKVGKAQAAQREGLQIQQALQQVESRRKAEAQVQEVNQAQDTGDGAERIKADDERRHSGDRDNSGGRDREDESSRPGPDESRNAFRDPALGRNIDISG